jgi:glycosyltransferase involved in cell wall biosynthesis
VTAELPRPLVSVIVPVRDGCESPRKTVDALLSQTLERASYEVIVVENGSPIRTAIDFGHNDVIAIRETSATNAYVARNAGLAMARGEIIAFTDADCVPEHDWLAQGVAALERETADLAAGPIRFVLRRPGSAAMAYDATHFLQAHQAVTDRSVAFMANLFVRRRVFDALGPLPTDSISGGDIRFSRLATRAGFRLVYAADAQVEHPARAWREMIVKAMRVGYGKARLTWRQASREIIRVEMLATLQVRSLNPLTLYRRVRAAGVSMPTALRSVAFGYVVAACALAGYAAGLLRSAFLPRPGQHREDARGPQGAASGANRTPSAPAAPAEFAVVIEAINLQLADASRLAKCLASLDAQTLRLRQARRVVLVYTGDIPEGALLGHCRRFPWLSLQKIPDGTGYEQAKALAAEGLSSPLIVFCDSDCVYEPQWLERLLEPFRDESVEIVGGETAIEVEGAYDLAVAMSFSFDGFTGRAGLYEGERFHFNNVAFRASLLAAHPIRFGDPVYRCPRLYATSLRTAGVHIHRQPAARAHHAPPNGLRHFFWRYLFLGHDAAAYGRIVGAEAVGGRRTWLREIGRRLRRAAALLTPGRVLYLPLAVPIAAAAVVLGVTGFVIRLVSEHLLLRRAPTRFLNGSSFDRRYVARRRAA